MEKFNMRSLRLFVPFIALASLGAISVFAQPAPRIYSDPVTANGGAFIHIARSTGDNINVTGHMTRLVDETALIVNDSPMTDGNPNAVVFLTHNATRGSGKQLDPFSAGLLKKSGVLGYIVNMPHNAGGFQDKTAFNVQVQGKSDTVFVHTAKPNNIGSLNYVTTIDHPLLNGNPAAVISVTQLWQGVYNRHQVTLWYDEAASRWTIYNEDQEPMPHGAKFNVQVLTDPDTTMQHTATIQNIWDNNRTQLNHPLLNNRYGAQFIVTRRWNGVYNDNPIGVAYSGTNWYIINTNDAAMPIGASFNIHITHNSYSQTNDGALANGGFEAPAADSLKKAAAWNSDAAGKGSKRVCNKHAPVSASTKLFSNTGDCAFKFKGANGETRKLVTTGLSGPVGHNGFVLQAWVKKSGPGVLTAEAKVTLNDGMKIRVRLPGAELSGEYDWKPVSAWHLLPPGTWAVKVKIKIKLAGAGKVYLDDVGSGPSPSPG
jgi:hypothetical protein